MALFPCGTDLTAGASDKEQIDDEDGDKSQGPYDDMKGFESQDALLAGKIGRRNVSAVMMVVMIEFRHGLKRSPE